MSQVAMEKVKCSYLLVQRRKCMKVKPKLQVTSLASSLGWSQYVITNLEGYDWQNLRGHLIFFSRFSIECNTTFNM